MNRLVTSGSLGALVLAGTLLAAIWAARVPFFQEPDEIAHADYALTILDGGPVRIRHGVPTHVVAPQTRLLVDASGYRAMRYDASAIVPPGYGTAAYDRAIDRRAPPPETRVPRDGAPIPYVSTFYPAPYYLVDAAIGRAVSSATRSLTTAFLWMRLFDVGLLAGTLLASIGIFRELRFSDRDVVLATAAVALFPLASWISGSIQPDDASALFLETALFLALRFRRTRDARTFWTLVAVLCALGFVKFHYAAIATVAVALGIRGAFHGLETRRHVLAIACVTLLPFCAIAVAKRYALVGGTLVLPGPGETLSHDLLATIAATAAKASALILSTFVAGQTFDGFWYHFGVRAGSAFSGPAEAVVGTLLSVASIATCCAVAIRELDVLRRIVVVARRRGIRVAGRFVASDVTFNAYVLLTLFLIGLATFTAGDLVPQGRYWYPVLVPTIALAATIVPRLFAHAARARARTALLACWAAYAVVAAPAELLAMERDFYVAKPVPGHELGEIRHVRVDGSSLADGATVRGGASLVVDGVAIDSSRGLPPRAIRTSLDGRFLANARTGLPSPALVVTFNDEALDGSGFRAVVPTRGLGPGRHVLTFLVVETRAPQGLPLGSFSFELAR